MSLENVSQIIAHHYNPPNNIQISDLNRFRMIFKNTTNKEAWILTLKKCISVLLPLILMISFMVMRHTTANLSDKTAILLLYANFLFNLLLIKCIMIYGRNINVQWLKRHYDFHTPEHKALLAEVWHSYLKEVPADRPGRRLGGEAPLLSVNELKALLNFTPNQAPQPSQFLGANGTEGNRLGS